jgi:hypothetical protein
LQKKSDINLGVSEYINELINYHGGAASYIALFLKDGKEKFQHYLPI